jgi:hypothetical protein
MPGRPRYDGASVRQQPLVTSANTYQFIEHLPRTMDAPPRCTLVALGDGLGWQVSVTLAPADQAALSAAQPSAYDLCAAAQHALGLAAIGSRIDPTRGTVVVHSRGAAQLAFAGAPSLWWVANAPPPLLHEWIDQLAAQLAQREVPDQPVAATTDHESPAGDN